MSEKQKKLLFWVNLIFAVLIVASDIIFICGLIHNKYIIKTITSSLFVLCGLFNFVCVWKFKNEYLMKSIFLLVGLFFAFLGDVFLIEHFVIGAALFAVGHVFFFIYFLSLYPFTKWDAIFAGAVMFFAICVILLYKGFEFEGMLPLVIIYALIISCMLGKAMGSLIESPSLSNWIMALGAFLFFFSDVMLLFNVFANVSRIFDILCLVTYYPAEFLLAITIWLQANNNKKLKE